MSKQQSYLIIGNGIAGITAAEVLRAGDATSTITIVADDPYPVYYRPALKDYLAGHMPEDKLWARPMTFYQEQRVRFVPGRVIGIHPAQHMVQLHDGQVLGYTKLLLANGAYARQLTCPGADLAGVSTLRSVADYQEIMRHLRESYRIVVVGSGTLAMESAETLNQRGFQIVHLLRNRTLWSEVIDSTTSDLVLREERRAGIDVRTDESVVEIVGKDGKVSEVITSSGAHIPCDMVLVAIGIDPIIDFVSASGIACGRGIRVDDYMRTSAPDIYAAGDVVEVVDENTGRTRVPGQWYPAILQARIAAYSMLNQMQTGQTFRLNNFYNATFLYGLDFVSVGITTQPPNTQYYWELIAEPKPRSYRKVLLKDGVPVGIIFLGERKNALAFKRAIDHRVNLASVANHVFDDNFDLDQWLDEQHVPEAIFTAPTKQDALAIDPSAYQAYFVPIPHPKVKVSVTETALNQHSQAQVVGRQADATLRVEHSSISRRHAEIKYVNGYYQLQDLGSRNGTFVNGTPLPAQKPYQLQQSDTIRFGDVQFSFQLRRKANPIHVDPQLEFPSEQTTFLHIAGTQLDTNTTRAIPANILAALKETTAPSLVLVAPNAQPLTIPLTGYKQHNTHMTLGRDKDNTIPLQDTATSRRHAEIFATPEGFYIRDLNSSNGVFVNKVKINNPYQLAHNDRIVIGNTLIYCSFPGTATATQQLTLAHTAQPARPSGTTALKTDVTSQLVAGLTHRSNTQALSPQHVQFEIDMCIGCDRCMVACPIPMSSMVNIADLNHATVTDTVAPHVAQFTHECIMCGSCVPVCPVDNHRDLLMLSLKHRVGEQWDGKVDMERVAKVLPPGWTIQDLGQHLRRQPLFQDAQRIPDNYLLHLMAASSLVSLTPGATLLREGEYGRDLYILLEGQLSASSMDISGQELPVTIFNPGEYVGEYGMLTGQQYTTTVRAQIPAQILRVPEQVMQHLMELVPSTRDFFSQLNNARSIEGILKRMALFQGVADADIRGLTGQTQIKHYERDERLFAEKRRGQPARETLHVLLEGFVKVARHDRQNENEERVIAYRQSGDYFAGGLDLLGDGKAVTVTAITRTRVAEVPRQALLTLFQIYPEVDQRFSLRLREYLESTASAHSGIFEAGAFTQYLPSAVPTDESARAGLHSLVSDGVVEGTEVLVIDLDKCIHCNECEEACARRHGHSRMNRKGMVIGNISITTTCRQCQDPVCMLCSRAGIARLPNGEVYITESCIGCGICAERCPYGAISIVNVDEPAEADTPSWQRFSNFFTKGAGKERARRTLPMANTTPAAPVASAGNKLVTSGPLDISKPRDAYEEMRKKIAIKCDLCAGYSDQACVQACPPGAAIRVKPTMFFGSTEDILRR